MGEPEPFDFATVVLPHLNEAYNLARWLMRSTVEAEEVVQEAMLRALNYFQSFRGSNARAWVLQIVRNVAYAALHKQRQAPVMLPLDADGADNETGLAALVDPTGDPEVLLARLQDGRRLDELLGALPVELRECVILFELNGASYKEIAAITGTPIGTVMSRLWRARRLLVRLALEGDR